MDKGTSESSLSFGRGQPSTIHPIAFQRLVLYCTVSEQIHLLSERKGEN